MGEKIKQFLRDYSYYLILVGYSFVLTCFMSYIQFGSVQTVLNFMQEHTFYFIVNFCIVLASMSLTLLVKRKLFIFSVLTLIWGLLSLANAIVTSLRGTPLLFSDFFLIQEAIKLVNLYFTPKVMMTFVSILVIMMVMIGFLLKVKSRVRKLDYVLCAAILLCATLGLYVVEKNDWMAPIKSNYKKSYETYGFSYSILNSMYPYIVSNNTSDGANIDELMNSMTVSAERRVNEQLPYNLIIVQLESFMDPFLIEGAEYSEDPIATFRELMEIQPSGTIVVPTFGAGTVMTEFEVLTSISMSALKPGEIPYDALLCTTPVQSLATIFNALGYETTFLHNYEGNFYNRHFAIRNLGFDTYVPLEYMVGDHGTHQIDKTDDPLLFDYVIQSLEQSEASDFIYAVTAGTHQPYSTSEPSDAVRVSVTNLSEDYRLPLQDYVNRLYSLDQQIARIVDYINNSDEPTLLVFFSDHLPNLSAVTDEETYDYDLYETPYLIYSNAELEAATPYEDMTSYQLGSYVLNLLGIDAGAMHKVHDLYAEAPGYQDVLDIVQKDLLYGEGRFYENTMLPQSSNLFFGLGELSITSVEQTDEILNVHGTGFSSESRVYLDGQVFSTTYVSPNLLQIVAPTQSYASIEIKQHSGLDQAIGQGVSVLANDLQ